MVAIVMLAIMSLGQTEHPALKQASTLIKQLEYSAGMVVLRKVLEQGGLTVAQQIEAQALLAVAHSARSEPEFAERTYLEILRLDPRFSLPTSTSPKMRQAFERAAARYRAMAPSGLKVQVHPEDGKVRVEGRFIDPGKSVATVWVRRAPAEVNAVQAPVTEQRKERAFAASLQLAPKTEQLKLYISLEAASGAPLLKWGSLETPKIVSIPQRAPRWYARWWVWTVVGVGVIGAATTAAVLATRDNDLLGRIKVPGASG